MVVFVIEGGAMRAAYASGVAQALQESNVVPEAIYGTSAGAVLGAWYASGRADLGARTWDHVGDRRIMSYRRAMRQRGPLIDFRYLYSHAYPERFGMDVAAMRAATFPVYATIANVETGLAEYPDLRHVEDPLGHLHATSAIPLISESPVELAGSRYVDGGIIDPIPLQRAIDDGHCDIILILNRPAGERRAEPRFLAEIVARRFPKVGEAARDHHGLHNRAVKLAEQPPTGVRVRIIRPDEDLGVGRLTRDPRRIRHALKAGQQDGARAANAWNLAPLN